VTVCQVVQSVNAETNAVFRVEAPCAVLSGVRLRDVTLAIHKDLSVGVLASALPPNDGHPLGAFRTKEDNVHHSVSVRVDSMRHVAIHFDEVAVAIVNVGTSRRTCFSNTTEDRTDGESSSESESFEVHSWFGFVLYLYSTP
jgi:hypothetical protein